jgi:hypothetical protein
MKTEVLGDKIRGKILKLDFGGKKETWGVEREILLLNGLKIVGAHNHFSIF